MHRSLFTAQLVCDWRSPLRRIRNGQQSFDTFVPALNEMVARNDLCISASAWHVPSTTRPRLSACFLSFDTGPD